MKTPQEVLNMAFAFMGEFGISINNTPQGILFARMSSRQRELLTWAATIDPEYFGASMIVDLDNGGADLNRLEGTVDFQEVSPVEAIQAVEVYAQQTPDDPEDLSGLVSADFFGGPLFTTQAPPATYRAGERVRIVKSNDTRDLPPRMTLRDNILRGVGNDMDNVVSIRVLYSRRPREINMDGTGTVEIADPFVGLLAFDVIKFICSRDPELARSAAMSMAADMETKTLASFEAHIRASRAVVESRF